MSHVEDWSDSTCTSGSSRPASAPMITVSLLPNRPLTFLSSSNRLSPAMAQGHISFRDLLSLTSPLRQSMAYEGRAAIELPIGPGYYPKSAKPACARHWTSGRVTFHLSGPGTHLKKDRQFFWVRTVMGPAHLDTVSTCDSTGHACTVSQQTLPQSNLANAPDSRLHSQGYPWHRADVQENARPGPAQRAER